MTFAAAPDSPLDRDLIAQAALVRRGEISPLELVEAAIERAEALSATVNAVITRRFDEAREEATRPLADGPFAGVPFLVKDVGIAARGMRTTFASDWVGDIVHTEDDELARRLRLAGLIFIGATNVPEMAVAASTESRRFGAVRNPWDPGRTAGGSSGGAAAAVAAGIVAAAHANDGSGSIRVPASCCGVFGFKPSGAAYLAATPVQRHARMAVQHAVTRSVRDSAALLDATAGHVNLGDPGVVPIPERPYLEELEREPGRLRIGLSTDSPRGLLVDPACVDAALDAARLLESLGHEVVEEAAPTPPDLQAALDLLETRQIDAMLEALEQVRRPLDPEAELPPVLREMGRRGAAASREDRDAALRSLADAADLVDRVWGGCDVLLTPTLAELPLPLGELNAWDPDFDNFFARDARFNPWGPIANWAGLPAASLPLHWSDGLPVGVQLAAAPGADALLLRLCAQLERARPWADRRPPLGLATTTDLPLVRPTARGGST